MPPAPEKKPGTNKDGYRYKAPENTVPNAPRATPDTTGVKKTAMVTPEEERVIQPYILFNTLFTS